METVDTTRIVGSVSRAHELRRDFRPPRQQRRRSDNERYQSIVDFSGVGDFINLAMKTYSTGMGSRLRFAIASAKSQDILLVDEALAVGDERFQLKCHDRIDAFRQAGKTVLLVSHTLEQIRINCARAIWIHRGHIIEDGESAAVTAAYHDWSVSGAEKPPAPRARP